MDESNCPFTKRRKWQDVKVWVMAASELAFRWPEIWLDVFKLALLPLFYLVGKMTMKKWRYGIV